MNNTHYDVAIIGGGPAGLQAALILARTRKRIIVFDSPEPPRNAASHGVHNFLGLDGLTPAEIREQAWGQIAVYDSAKLRHERVIDVNHHADKGFIVTGEAGSAVTAKHVILALGFRDVHPNVPGFTECWGDTIIGCPYCDGYENRDRAWGVVVTNQLALEHMPRIFRNWTPTASVIVASNIPLDDAQRQALTAQGVGIHEGDIVEVHHTGGKVESITLHTGARVPVEALWWKPDETAMPLTEKIAANFSLDLNENGTIKTDMQYETSVKGLWAVGDVLRTFPTALNAAYQGSLAAYAITRIWYAEQP